MTPRVRSVGPAARLAAPVVLLRASGQALEFLGWVILARELGTAEFGTVAVAFLICRYGGLVADWGASIKGARDVAAGRHPTEIHALVRRRLIVGLALTVAFAIGVVLAGVAELAPLGLTILARGAGRDWLALGRARGVLAGLPPAAQGGLVAAGSLFATTAATSAWVLGGAYLLAAILSIAVNPLPHHTTEAPADRQAVDPWFLVLMLADQVYASLDVILLAMLQSSSDAGIYAAVYRFPNAIITIIGLVITSLVPTAARAAAHADSLSELRRRALRLGRRCCGAVLITIPLAWWLVPIVFGEAYIDGRPALVILLVATSFPALTIGLQPLYFAVGRDRSIALYAVAVAIVNLCLNLVLIPLLGLVGAASATLVAQALIAGFYLRNAGRRRQTP